MANWTYSNWRSYATLADRRARLALYIQELEDAMKDRSIGLSADGKSQSKDSLTTLINKAQEAYDAMPGTGGGFGKTRRQRA